MTSGTLVSFFQAVVLVASALVSIKLYTSGLYRRYRFFFGYFLFRIPNALWPLLVDSRSTLYFWLWVITEPIAFAFHVLVVLELYRLVLEGHKGLYSLGRWVMGGALAISITISILALLPHITPVMPQRTAAVGYGAALGRGVDSSMLLFLILILLFLSRYPVRLSRNVIVHASLYSAYFVTETAGFLLRSFFGLHQVELTDLFFTGASAVCLVLWFLLLSREGEEVKTTLPHFSPEQEQRLLHQLDALNETLLKASRK